MDEIKWPKGKTTEAFKRKVYGLRNQILTGRVLAIDPASGHSSMPGYALYEGGVLIEAGVVDVPPKDTPHERLDQLYQCFRDSFEAVDILAIEHLRGGKVHNTLHWATGIAVAGIKHRVRIDVPIPFWHAIAKAKGDYVKSDDGDAVLIGEVLMRLAK